MDINLSLRHLRAFVAVADCGGYSAASRQVNLAQSALSRTIKEIEDELAVSLFDRTTRRVSLTAAGEQLLLNAREAIASFDGAFLRFQHYREGLSGTVSLAALSSVASILLPPVIFEFQSLRPNVRVSLEDGFAGEVVDSVMQGRVDFGITSLPRKKGRLICEKIAADTLTCICSSRHRFASKRSIEWRDIEGEDFVSFALSSSIFEVVEQGLRSADVSLGNITKARDIGTVAGLVSSDLGISVVPSLVLPMMQFCEYRGMPLSNPVVERNIYLIYDPETPMPPASTFLMDLLRRGPRSKFKIPNGVRWIDYPDGSCQANSN
ncbi:LysR family transcriptional regulator [Limibacillus halophilus]|uniref:DNA-binding transcriptional LysR family regulator n=1 Tax=Limibacillus halophilus TaxID=1579333 RepID=A0A839SNZ8_9PROT|nr:LysR family transcriptional regulator [Limibacillus halophilus]MBB3064531.1 DNA-binding transcriptional LysR family regulator [Limibacillus halophilus]